MKPTDKQITNALEYLDDSTLNKIVQIKEDKKSIPNAYNGYIASFGGSIVQTGLLTTALIYCNDTSSGNTPCRAKLAAALFHLYKKEPNKEGIVLEDSELLRYLQNNWTQWTVEEKKRVRNQLVKIATALKLAIRSYELEK